MAGDISRKNDINTQTHPDLDAMNPAQMMANALNLALENTASKFGIQAAENIAEKLETASPQDLDNLIADLREDGDLDNTNLLETIFGSDSPAAQFVMSQLAASGAGGAFQTAFSNKNDDPENPRGRRNGKKTLSAAASLLQLDAATQQAIDNFFASQDDYIAQGLAAYDKLKDPIEKAVHLKAMQDKLVKGVMEETGLPEDKAQEVVDKRLLDQMTSMYMKNNKNMSEADARAMAEENYTPMKEALANSLEAQKLYQAQQDLNLATSNISQAKADLESAQNTITEIENSMREMQEKIDNGDQASHMMNYYNAQITEQQSALDAAQAELEQKEEAYQSAQKNVEGLKTENASLMTEINKLGGSMAQDLLTSNNDNLEAELAALEKAQATIENEMRAQMDIPEDHKGAAMEETRFQMENQQCRSVDADGTGNWLSKANSDATMAANMLASSDLSEKWKHNDERLKELTGEDKAEDDIKLSNAFNNNTSENNNTAKATHSTKTDVETTENLTLDAPHPAEIEHRAQMVNKIENYADQIKASGVTVATLEDLHSILDLEGSEALKHNTLIEKTLADAGIEVKDAFDPNPEPELEMTMSTQPEARTCQPQDPQSTMSIGVG